MKKILTIFLSLVLMLGITSMAFAVTEDKEPVKVKSAAEAVEDQIVIEEPIKVETETESVEAVKEEEPVEVAEEPTERAEEDETVCPHTWGEWYYDLIEYEDGSTTYFRTCECGAYEELEYQKWSDLGGQYEDCDKGRHYWCEEENIRYCEECEYIEESI